MTTFRAPLKSENESKDDASQIQHDAQIQQDPHLGSFIKEEHEALLSGDHEEVEYEDDPEYKKDKTISTVFIGFASIALLGAGIMFLNNQEALHNPIDIVQETLRNSLTNSDAQSTTTEHVSSDIDASIPRDEFMEQYKARLVELQNTVSDRPAQNTSASAEQTAQQNTDATEQELVKSEKSNTSLTNTATNIIQFNREQKLTEIVFSDALGVSFLKDPYWKQTVKNNTVTLSMVGPNSDNVITLIRFKGVSVTTEDSVRGSVTYYYDTTDKSWMIIELAPSVQEGDTVKPQPYIPLRYTKSGLPLLSGTSRYKTYIVVRGVQDFIIVNINGSGYTDILDDFVHEIRSY